jgi:hypothetical protein
MVAFETIQGLKRNFWWETSTLLESVVRSSRWMQMDNCEYSRRIVIEIPEET